MLRGWPSESNRSPTAFNTASGQPSPEDDDTVTMAPSGMRRAASEAEITFCLDILPHILRSIGVATPERAASRTERATLRDLTPSSPVADGAPCRSTAA